MKNRGSVCILKNRACSSGWLYKSNLRKQDKQENTSNETRAVGEKHVRHGKKEALQLGPSQVPVVY